MDRPIIVGVGGFTSNVGKTTLMCELLSAFSGWEAIKTTRGHYRSCGKESDACCVSGLLGESPLVLSDRNDTEVPGKDTGRYWQAGAENVHWLIATQNQVELGIHEVLKRVRSSGVFIEGNSFSQFVRPDYFIMVKRHDSEKIKGSARRALQSASALYVSDLNELTTSCQWSCEGFPESVATKVYCQAELPSLIDNLQVAINAARFKSACTF